MKGVSPIVSFSLLTLTVIFSTIIVLQGLTPFLNRVKDISTINKGINSLEELGSVIKTVAESGEGSVKILSLDFGDVVFYVDNSSEEVYFVYDLKSDTSLEGGVGEIHLCRNPIFTEFFSEYSVGGNVSDTWRCYNSCNLDFSLVGLQNSSIASDIFLDEKFYVEASFFDDVLLYFLPAKENNLQLYIPFDTNFKDYSVYKRLTLNNNSELADGKFGNSGYFNGSSEISVNQESMSIDSFTISLWFKPNSLTGTQVLVSKKQNLWDDNGFALFLNSSSIICNIGNSSNFVSYEDSGLVGNWSYLSCNFNGTYLNIFLNGELVAHNSTLHSYIPNTENISIGDSYRGFIDEIRVYNVSLDTEGIKKEYLSFVLKSHKSFKKPFESKLGNLTLVLSSATEGEVEFVKICSLESKRIYGILPFYGIHFNTKIRLGKGNVRLRVENLGYDENLEKTVIRVSVL